MCTRRSCKLSSIDAEKCFSACPQSESVSNCAIQRFAFQIHCMSNRVYTVYPIVYTQCVYPIAKRKHYAANINCTICHITQICTFKMQPFKASRALDGGLVSSDSSTANFTYPDGARVGLDAGSDQQKPDSSSRNSTITCRVS